MFVSRKHDGCEVTQKAYCIMGIFAYLKWRLITGTELYWTLGGITGTAFAWLVRMVRGARTEATPTGGGAEFRLAGARGLPRNSSSSSEKAALPPSKTHNSSLILLQLII